MYLLNIAGKELKIRCQKTKQFTSYFTIL